FDVEPPLGLQSRTRPSRRQTPILRNPPLQTVGQRGNVVLLDDFAAVGQNLVVDRFAGVANHWAPTSERLHHADAASLFLARINERIEAVVEVAQLTHMP